MKRLLLLSLLLASASVMQAGDANWPMGTPDGGWAMGTPDNNYPMDGRQIAVAEHRIQIGFTQDEVIRALGEPSSVNRTVTANRVTDFWHYEVGNRILLTVMFENSRVTSFSGGM
jgi:hypothetical protein